MDLTSSVLIGLAGGLVATTAMTLMELPFWRMWRLQGVLEWHENQVLISKFLSLDEKQLHFSGIFGLHFLNGALGGLGLVLLALYFRSDLSNFSLIALSVGYGFLLWILTLVPIHKPITGIHPWNHPLGRAPAIASLAGHLLYGIILGIFLLLAGFA
jgi:hypothetical protein